MEILNALKLWSKFSEKRKSVSKNWNMIFQLKHVSMVESTKIKNTTFPYKTALSEVTAKPNRMRSRKWTHHKESFFASNYFIFLKICVILRTSYEVLIWCTEYPNVHIHTLRKRWSFIWGCFFTGSILKVIIYTRFLNSGDYTFFVTKRFFL